MKIVVLDYGMGNLMTVRRRLAEIGVDPVVSSRMEDILEADKLILPGVGHFGRAMSNLKNLNLIDPLNEFVLNRKKPILGICLGLQLMTKYSEEGELEGFGWFDAMVSRFEVVDSLKYKIPHTGWNEVHWDKESRLVEGIPSNSEFYFVHAYRCISINQSDVLGTAVYESKFVSALEKDNIFGVQFHPEKSHMAGSQMLSNFIKL